MRGVIYARYSSDNQREESIEGQLRENTAYAKKNGIEIVGTYIDRAVSAKTDNRPEFQRMIKDSAKKGFDVVIVWKLDRFARNRFDSARYKAALKKNNVRVISATEAISEGAEGIILESVLEGMAEYYSAELAEKVTGGMTENALKCKFNGGTLPYGYMVGEDQHLQVNPAQAPVVIEMFRRYAGGESMTSIIEDLNARGIRTSRGNRFDKNSLSRIFANRKYIGEYKFRDVVVPNGVPAIVSEDLFQRVAVRTKQNQHAQGKSKAPETYILTTKARLEELEAEEERLIKCIQEEEAKIPKISKEMILYTLYKYRDMDMRVQKNRERLIDGFVKAITVYDDYFKVHLTYTDEPIEMPTTEEIEFMDQSSDIASAVSPKETNPNYFVNRNWFGFVFYDTYPDWGFTGLSPKIVRQPLFVSCSVCEVFRSGHPAFSWCSFFMWESPMGCGRKSAHILHPCSGTFSFHTSVLPMLLFFLQHGIDLVRVLFDEEINDCPNDQITNHKNATEHQNRRHAPFQPAIGQICAQIAQVQNTAMD